MTKSIYNNTITIPGASTDVISDGSTIGGDIIANDKALADLIHKGGTGGTAASVAIGTGSGLSADGTHGAVVAGYECYESGHCAVTVGGYNLQCPGSYCGLFAGQNSTVRGSSSVVVGGESNTVDANDACIAGGVSNNLSGSYAVVAGGLNCRSNLQGGVSTNFDYHNVDGGGYTFIKGLSIPAYSTSYGSSVAICDVPSGGMAVLELHILDTTFGEALSGTYYIRPFDSGTIYTSEVSSEYTHLELLYENGTVYALNDGSGAIQIGVRGTVFGAFSSGSGSDSDSDDSDGSDSW